MTGRSNFTHLPRQRTKNLYLNTFNILQKTLEDLHSSYWVFSQCLIVFGIRHIHTYHVCYLDLKNLTVFSIGPFFFLSLLGKRILHYIGICFPLEISLEVRNLYSEVSFGLKRSLSASYTLLLTLCLHRESTFF